MKPALGAGENIRMYKEAIAAAWHQTIHQITPLQTNLNKIAGLL
jgi:hypothetical protein